MNRQRLLLVGLEAREARGITHGFDGLFIAHEALPVVQLDQGVLYAESNSRPGTLLKVDAVIYHGIFEHDVDFITLLALWGGPCLPDAQGMLDCRLRHAGLARALRITRFGTMPRGMAIHAGTCQAPETTVAKWGNWHCGENKSRFTGAFEATEPTVFEPFIEGEAVRIMRVGDQFWQLRLAGDDWLKSIHHADAACMPMDEALQEDTRRLTDHFRLVVAGVDYMIGHDGQKYLLEVNHIPNVTVFPFINAAYIRLAQGWCQAMCWQGDAVT
ncbi:hypothetical protein SAMN05421823_113131 [Catalinimonas alkaloidigena]|uniref:ATP-grasp domain-containing protein n=1 Tax=Catalinimonas alkaloidigena TaxID=1075417 RepID=A0A1G9T990_9BACT|nr:hypothetical protein [Catalinimonas alkaloidigena]SDM44313.1 hypothetical protein SAMN05421823_113131 [Catalinimonas alkaloidigena]